MSGKPWTTKDEKLIGEFYSLMSAKNLHVKHMPNRTPAAIKKRALKLGVPHFPGKDLAGLKIGQLEIIRYEGQVKFAGRDQTSWLCLCDCGEEITLVYEKLPTSKLERATMDRGGGRLYDCCESCREKTCPVCGDRFIYSHKSHICTKTSCRDKLHTLRRAFWGGEHKHRMDTDKDYRDSINAYKKGWNKTNRTKQALSSMIADADKLQKLIEDVDE